MWTYTSATFKGSASNPQPGDSVTVTLQEDSDPDNVLEHLLTWGFDGKLTKATFVAMVKREVKAHLLALNAAPTPNDATSVFDPA